ncbi:MAG: M81 family metallopeptidase, partial [Candidimonas sp.]
MARIAVGGFQHETNCFVTQTTDFDYFLSHRDRPPLVRGGELLRWLNGTTFAMAGFLREMGTQARATIVPLVWASGGAGGTVTRDAFERITGELIGALS